MTDWSLNIDSRKAIVPMAEITAPVWRLQYHWDLFVDFITTGYNGRVWRLNFVKLRHSRGP